MDSGYYNVGHNNINLHGRKENRGDDDEMGATIPIAIS
jgi:hypothetical protein